MSSWETLFTVRVRHPFYAGGRGGAWGRIAAGLASDPATRRLLAARRCVGRPIPGGVMVARELDAAGAPRVPADGATFRFRLAPADGDFASVTDLSELAALESPLYTNRDLAGGPEPGALRLIAGPDRRRSPPGTVAEVEILVDAAAPAPAAWTVDLRPRRRPWVFYCLTDLEGDADTFELVDAVPANGEEPLVFERQAGADPGDPIARQLAERFAPLRLLRFVSTLDVVSRSRPRRHLELRLDGVRRRGPLPNPALRRLTRLRRDGDSQPRPALYQIVRILTHSP